MSNEIVNRDQNLPQWMRSKSTGASLGNLDASDIKPPEVKLYKLSQAADAHSLSQSRHFKGKLVFQVR